MTTKIQAGNQPAFVDPKGNDIDANYCVQCGRKCGSNPWFIEVIKGGEIRQQDGINYNASQDAGYMGWWAVGNECAKQFESNVLFKMEVSK